MLNDLYDAEVNYQDHLLGPLLEFLSQADNTLTIIVADHGEGIGEHSFMGHSFVAYQELVHVPLIVRFPDGMATGQRQTTNVSTRRIFHTILAAAGIHPAETNHRPASAVTQLDLRQTVQGNDPEQGIVFVEAYPPNTIQTILEKHAPQSIEKFHCTLTRRAAYKDHFKLVRIEGVQDELFDLVKNPSEEQNIAAHYTEHVQRLSLHLRNFIMQAVARQPDTWQANRSLNLNHDETLIKQLRALGYLE